MEYKPLPVDWQSFQDPMMGFFRNLKKEVLTLYKAYVRVYPIDPIFFVNGIMFVGPPHLSVCEHK